MGLQVWLPLNGNLDNQGLGSFSPTLSNGSWDNNGKIGQCYNSNGSGVINLNNSITLDGTFSICCWVKVSSSHTSAWARVFGLYKNVNEYIGVCCNNTSPISLLGFHIYDLVNDAKKGLIDTYRIQAKLDQWTHIAVSVDGTALKMYQDGVLLFTYTLQQQVNDTYTVNQLCAQNGSAKLNCCINDFRIYDHALSPREVKEISKGLVLHYPLAVSGGENILKNSLTNFPQLWDGSGDGRTLTTQSGVSVPEWGCTDALRVYGKSGATNALCLLINGTTHGLTVSGTSVSGQKYTPSIYIKNNHSTNLITIAFNSLASSQVVNAGDVKKVILNATGNGHSYIQFTISASGVNKEYDFTFWHPKIELGEVCTPWVPATTDSLYSAMGFNDGIEYDVSGYGHNGTKTGAFAYDADTPRYNTSTCFNLTDTRITPPIIFQSGAKIPEISFSFWMKRNDYTDAKNHYIYNDICQIYTYSDYLLRISWKHDTESSSTGNTSAGSSAITTPNEWHHICYTFDKGYLRLYIDGEFKYGSDRTDTGQFMGVYNYRSIGYASGSNISYGGCLSDFRIYATALTFDQIKDLYHTPISLANNGALLTQSEYEEV